MRTPTLECRTSEGETVGLIDAAIHVLRQIARRDLSHPAVREALADLRADPEVRTVML
jgi:hypothetical protein